MCPPPESDSAPAQHPRIRIGCQGWTYPGWAGTFYPPGSRQETLLPFYADIFDTVEIDSTFYGPPKPTIVRSWARNVPPGFRFGAKLPRAITHDSGLREVGEPMREFARAMEPMGEKLGPLLVQLPPDFVREESTVATLRRFFTEAPSGLRLAVEFRHASWHGPETFDLLRENGASLAWTDWRNLPAVLEVTARFLYVRWLGVREDILRYDRLQIDRGAELDTWAERFRNAFGVVDEIYGYFNNHWAGHSPASVNEFLRRLDLPAVEPRERWPQRELW